MYTHVWFGRGLDKLWRKVAGLIRNTHGLLQRSLGPKPIPVEQIFKTNNLTCDPRKPFNECYSIVTQSIRINNPRLKFPKLRWSVKNTFAVYAEQSERHWKPSKIFKAQCSALKSDYQNKLIHKNKNAMRNAEDACLDFIHSNEYCEVIYLLLKLLWKPFIDE